MNLHRRQFIQYATTALSALPLSLRQTLALAKESTSLHVDIAQMAKSLKKTDKLKMLLPKGSEFNVEPIAKKFADLVAISIEFETVPVDDINTRILLDKQLNNIDWDIALPATFGIPDLAEAGAIRDLTDLKSQYEPQGLCDNSYYTLGDYYSNRFYGYQTDGDVYMMFYNQLVNTPAKQKAFEDQFGYSYRMPITWNELDQHLKFFHSPENEIYGGSLFRTSNYLVWEFWSRFHAKGLLPLQPDLTPNIDNDAGILVLENMLETMEYLHPNARKDGLVDNWRTYAKGNIYANIGWGGTQKYFVANNSPVLGNLRYSSLPGGSTKNSFIDAGYFNWGWNYTVSPVTKDPTLAYLFTQFAVAPGPSIEAVSQEKGFFDPFRQEHYQDHQIQKIYTGEFLHAHQNSMKNCIPDFYLHGQQLYMGDLRRYLTAAMDGQLTPQKALTAAAESWQNTHIKMGLEQQTNQWAFLRSQYPLHF